MPSWGTEPQGRSLGHHRRELGLYRRQCNKLRLHGGIEWKTPAEVYRDRKLMRRVRIPRG